MRWARIAPFIAVSSPLLIAVLVSVGFLMWFGLVSAREVEALALRKEHDTLGLVASYMQHLVDDAHTNIDSVTREVGATHSLPTAARLAELRGRFRSNSHIKFVGVVATDGHVIVSDGTLVPGLSKFLPELVTRAARQEQPAFWPHRISANSTLADFAVAAPLPDKLGSLVLDIASEGRGATLNVLSADAAFVLIDSSSADAALFGQTTVESSWLRDVLNTLSHSRMPPAESGCEGSFPGKNRCFAYWPFKDSPLALASAIDPTSLFDKWVDENRTVWLFAAIIALAGIASSVFNAIVVRRRHRDRLELAAALADLSEAYESKSNFMAHLSHELRTPLNSIIGFSDLIRGEHFGPVSERYRGYADDIHFSAMHLHTMASDIMDAERLERGEFVAHSGQADLNAIIADARRVLTVLAEKRDISIEIAPWPQAAIVAIDPHRAMQIAVNLLSNAIKYSEPGDHVVMSVEPTTSGGYTLVVADQGIGMTPEEISYTTQPFRQPATWRSGRHDSVGLGLPIVRGLLAMAGGHLIISSEKNHGTTVSAVFARAAAESAG